MTLIEIIGILVGAGTIVGGVVTAVIKSAISQHVTTIGDNFKRIEIAHNVLKQDLGQVEQEMLVNFNIVREKMLQMEKDNTERFVLRLEWQQFQQQFQRMESKIDRLIEQRS